MSTLRLTEVEKLAQGPMVGIQMQVPDSKATLSHTLLPWPWLCCKWERRPALRPSWVLGMEPVLLWKGLGGSVSATQLSFTSWSCHPGKDWPTGSSLMEAVPGPHPILLLSPGTPLALRPPKPCLLPDKFSGLWQGRQ